MTTAARTLTPATDADLDDPDWWRQAVVYQIYPRSFADANGDGIGDLARHHLAGRLPRRARDRRGLAQPVLPVGARRRRLRRRRLPRRRPAAGHAGRLRRDGRARCTRAGIRVDRRHRAQPHLRPARVVPGGARLRPRARRRASATSSATGTGPDGARAADGLGVAVRRPGLGAGRRRAVVPAPLRRRAARPELGATARSATTSCAPCASGPTAASTASASTSRTCSTKDLTEPLPSQGRARRHCRRRRHRTRSWTATRCTRSTPSGARSSTSTTRRAPPSPRPGSTPAARPAVRQPEGPGPGVQLRPARGRLRRRASSARSSTDNLALAARVRLVDAPGCSPTTTSSGTPPATACPHRARGTDGRPATGTAVAAVGRRRAGARRRPRPAPRPRRHPVHAGPARLGATCTRARSSACTRSPTSPTPQRQDPTFFRSPGVEIGRDGCRVPLPWTRRRPVVRLRRRRRRTCRSRRGWRLRRRGAGGRPGTRRWSSTAGPCGCAANCSRARNSSGSTPAGPTCCASAGPAAGRS